MILREQVLDGFFHGRLRFLYLTVSCCAGYGSCIVGMLCRYTNDIPYNDHYKESKENIVAFLTCLPIIYLSENGCKDSDLFLVFLIGLYKKTKCKQLVILKIRSYYKISNMKDIQWKISDSYSFLFIVFLNKYCRRIAIMKIVRYHYSFFSPYAQV